MYTAFIGARPEEIAFTHSTSEGMNIIAHMLAHRGHAISNDLEFPSSNLPWINRGADMTIVPSRNGMVPIERIRKAIGKKLEQSSLAMFNIQPDSGKTWRH